MINAGDLTRILFEEARHFAERMVFDGEPNLSSSEKFSRLTASDPLPNDTKIEYALEEIFWASTLTEEGRPCRPRMLYTLRQQEMRRGIHRLKNPISLSREVLRKLVAVQGPLGYLTWDCVSGSPEITGVYGREGGDPSNFIIAAPKNGAVDISWSGARLVASRAGRVDRLSQASLPGMYEALNLIQRVTGNRETAYLAPAIRAIANEGHGGAIWIMREDHTYDGVNIEYPIRIDERSLPQDSLGRSNWMESVGHLAGADGAIVIDSKARVVGFGAFIDFPNKPRAVIERSLSGELTSLKSTKLGGGRHRSALEFCVRFAPAAAIVVSEDGTISVMCAASPEETPWRMHFSTLGIVTDTIL